MRRRDRAAGLRPDPVGAPSPWRVVPAAGLTRRRIAPGRDLGRRAISVLPSCRWRGRRWGRRRAVDVSGWIPAVLPGGVRRWTAAGRRAGPVRPGRTGAVSTVRWRCRATSPGGARSGHGDVLPFASTANAARDMDVVRAALGEPKLSYLGYSYGSYLGALYMQMFPDRADRFVVDSTIDPAQPGTFKGRDSGAGERGGAGGEPTVQHRWSSHFLPGRRVRHPLHIGPYLVDDRTLPALLLDPLSDDSGAGAQLAATIQVLGDGGPRRIRPAHSRAGRHPGRPADRRPVGAGTARRPRSHVRGRGGAARPRVLLSGTSSVTGRRRRCSARSSVTSRRARSGRPVRRRRSACTTRYRRSSSRRPGTSAPRSTWAGRCTARSTGSRMITLDGVRTHGVYLFRGNGCVDDTVNAYLNTGVLPPADLTCR